MFRVGFQKDGWRPEYYDNRASVDTANDVQAGDVADADLASTGRITGKVTEEGDPSDNTIVGLHRFVGGQWLYWDSVTTDMDGDYELLLPGDVGPSEVFRVGFEKYGWRTEYFDDKASVELAQDLKSGDVADADLAAAGRITGVVTEDGSPSEGVTVGAYRFDGGQWDPSVQAFTDASGAYELILPGDAAGSEDFLLGFEKAGWRTEYFDDKTSLAAAQAVQAGGVADADLMQAGSISGRVTLNGAPAEGATVTAFVESGGNWTNVASATTDVNGEYKMVTGAGQFAVQFFKNGWMPEFYDNQSVVADADLVDVQDGAPPGSAQYDVDADLAPGTLIEDLTGPLEASDLAATLAGPGVTVTSVKYTGDDRGAGAFDKFDPLGFNRGVVLGSGAVTEAVGPNKLEGTTTVLGTLGDSDLDALVSGETRDSSVLEIDFVPSGSKIDFTYVFGSEEYNEFVGSAFDDVFGFFVNGTNCAVVPNTTERVSVNSINLGKNATLYRDNSVLYTGPVNVEMDGLTVPLNCTATVNPGVTNTLKLAIADRGDSVLDSAVFLQRDSLTSNQAPVADAQQVSTPQGVAKALVLTGSDPDGDPLSYSVVSGPAHGTLSGTAPNVTYTPDAGFFGVDEFSFKVSDGQVSSPAASVKITVDKANQAPVADAQQVSTPQGVAKALVLTGSDPDGDPLSYSVVSGPAHGTLSGTAPNVTYTPDAGFFGVDEFSFKVSDGQVSSPAASVKITVDKANQAPVADAQQVSTPQGVAKALVLTGSDPDGDPLSYSVVSGPAHGTLSGTAPNVTYTPDAGFFGVDEFSFKVSDGQVSSPAASVKITVDKASQPPAVEPGPPQVTPPPEVKPGVAPPSKVTGVTVKRKKTSAVITWDPVQGSTGYVVTVGNKSFTLTKAKFTLKNLAKTKRYTVKISAVNAAGSSGPTKVTVKRFSKK